MEQGLWAGAGEEAGTISRSPAGAGDSQLSGQPLLTTHSCPGSPGGAAKAHCSACWKSQERRPSWLACQNFATENQSPLRTMYPSRGSWPLLLLLPVQGIPPLDQDPPSMQGEPAPSPAYSSAGSQEHTEDHTPLHVELVPESCLCRKPRATEDHAQVTQRHRGPCAL